ALAQIVGAGDGSLMISGAHMPLWTSSPNAVERAEKFMTEGWYKCGNMLTRFLAARHSGFLREIDFMTAEELDLEPIVRDFWRPAGVGSGVCTAIPFPTGETLMFMFTRGLDLEPADRAALEQLDALRPHLARSALMSARLRLERARIASETLAVMGLPALVLDERGNVLAANSLIEALTRYIHWRAQDRVSLKDRSADKLLRDAIAAIDVAGGSVRSFPVRDAANDAMMVAHVVPIRLSARDIFVRCAAVLVLTPVTLPQAPPVELVQSLFDLTPAEARVARGLASGETVEGIASARGVSQNTIRAHVRGVLEKTGCNRQVDIVALLTAISSTRLTHPI
ncbi:MAG: helix-turn-helix transcriptional regulator, partial [Methylocella sp.]